MTRQEREHRQAIECREITLEEQGVPHPHHGCVFLTIPPTITKYTDMPITLDTVSGQALGLPPAQRLSLARTLIESVEGTQDASFEAAWDVEIRARLTRFQAGETTSIPAADVFRRLREIAPGS